jgi:hypothetical protein
MNALVRHPLVQLPRTMKQNLSLTMVTCVACCVDKELWKAIEFLKEQVRVPKQEHERDKRISLHNRQSIRLVAKTKTADTVTLRGHRRPAQEGIHQSLNRIIGPQHESYQGNILLKSYHRQAA